MLDVRTKEITNMYLVCAMTVNVRVAYLEYEHNAKDVMVRDAISDNGLKTIQVLIWLSS